jgi:hypothetical protein
MQDIEPRSEDKTVMRPFIIAVIVALVLTVLWSAILPLTAQPGPAQASVTSPAISKALFLCRGPNGIDRTCTAALAKALVLEQSGDAVTHLSDRICHADRQMLAILERHK